MWTITSEWAEVISLNLLTLWWWQVIEKYAEKQDQVSDHTDEEDDNEGTDDDGDDEGKEDNHGNNDNNAEEATAIASDHSANVPVGEVPQQNSDNAGYEWSVNISSESEDDAPTKGSCHAF